MCHEASIVRYYYEPTADDANQQLTNILIKNTKKLSPIGRQRAYRSNSFHDELYTQSDGAFRFT